MTVTTSPVPQQDLQQLCEMGQEQLMRMDYLAAEATLARAESQAWSNRDWDTLSRLYMPLQEARRQRRQRCGEGVVVLDLAAQGPDDDVDGRHVVENFPHGQLLVAGWGTIEPARQVRRLQAEHGLFVETFLGAAYPSTSGRLIAIIPLEDTQPLPAPSATNPPEVSPETLAAALPPHSIVLRESELPGGSRTGNTQTYAEVMALWERLHTPFLAAADAESDPVRRMEGYRRTLRVDYACELAHQKLSDVAKQLSRAARAHAAISR